jgi:hypothetical protein
MAGLLRPDLVYPTFTGSERYKDPSDVIIENSWDEHINIETLPTFRESLLDTGEGLKLILCDSKQRKDTTANNHRLHCSKNPSILPVPHEPS